MDPFDERVTLRRLFLAATEAQDKRIGASLGGKLPGQYRNHKKGIKVSIDLSNFLPYYRSWATNVLRRRWYDAELVRDLERVRDNHQDMVEYYSGVLKEYESPEKQKDREDLLLSITTGKEYCARIVTTANQIIEEVNCFER
jgi:hypothetical protein